MDDRERLMKWSLTVRFGRGGVGRGTGVFPTLLLLFLACTGVLEPHLRHALAEARDLSYAL